MRQRRTRSRPTWPAKHIGFWSGFRCGQQAQEIGRFPRPTAADFAREHDQSGPGASTHQLWISPSFRRLALTNATPSRWAAPGRAVPSARTGDTRVLHPPKRGRPSATTSSLRPSSAGCATPRSKSRTMTLVVTRAPASFGRGHLHREATSCKQTRPWTHAMVAKGVQRAATTTDGNTRRERQAETAKQQQAEQVRLDASVKARWRSGQSSTGHGTALRPEESLQPGHQAGSGARPWKRLRVANPCAIRQGHPMEVGWACTSNQSGNWTHTCH